ncbi:hypothetical protein BDV93DRAFT_505410 [Ceratobasidium sp. AG-I]|nr:hypothetical protein BDV93DRAFT_505410 [Ceratobasidium sp. AG-I]
MSTYAFLCRSRTVPSMIYWGHINIDVQTPLRAEAHQNRSEDSAPGIGDSLGLSVGMSMYALRIYWALHIRAQHSFSIQVIGTLFILRCLADLGELVACPDEIVSERESYTAKKECCSISRAILVEQLRGENKISYLDNSEYNQIAFEMGWGHRRLSKRAEKELRGSGGPSRNSFFFLFKGVRRRRRGRKLYA